MKDVRALVNKGMEHKRNRWLRTALYAGRTENSFTYYASRTHRGYISSMIHVLVAGGLRISSQGKIISCIDQNIIFFRKGESLIFLCAVHLNFEVRGPVQHCITLEITDLN
jgi:hypothetical protein